MKKLLLIAGLILCTAQSQAETLLACDGHFYGPSFEQDRIDRTSISIIDETAKWGGTIFEQSKKSSGWFVGKFGDTTLQIDKATGDLLIYRGVLAAGGVVVYGGVCKRVAPLF